MNLFLTLAFGVEVLINFATVTPSALKAVHLLEAVHDLADEGRVVRVQAVPGGIK